MVRQMNRKHAHRLNPNHPAAAAKYRADGFTELEFYLNELGR